MGAVGAPLGYSVNNLICILCKLHGWTQIMQEGACREGRGEAPRWGCCGAPCGGPTGRAYWCAAATHNANRPDQHVTYGYMSGHGLVAICRRMHVW